MRYPGAALGGIGRGGAGEAHGGAGARGSPSGAATASRPCGRRGSPRPGRSALEVDVKLGEELVRGRFAGMDREGALLLETPAGPRRIVAGELLGRAA